jgi:hypothetical protein
MALRSTVDLLAHLASVATYANRKDEPDDDAPKDIEVAALKRRALKEVRQQRMFEWYEKEERKGKSEDSGHSSPNMIVCTDVFMNFVNTPTCDNIVIAAIYYVSATFRLKGQGPRLNEKAYAQEDRNRTDALRILSSLYCQTLLSPASSNLRVREERMFYETLIFFLDACVCFALHTENPDPVYELLARIFRRDLPDPRVRRRGEFLPISEIVRRHWLSQRVPGKTRSELSHSTLQGTTKLVEPICARELSTPLNRAPIAMGIWEISGYPKDTQIPIGATVIRRSEIVDLSPPKQTES